MNGMDAVQPSPEARPGSERLGPTRLPNWETLELEQKAEPDGEGEVLYLWMSRQTICDQLGVPSHALYRLVERGDAAVDLEGNRPRYRLTRPIEDLGALVDLVPEPGEGPAPDLTPKSDEPGPTDYLAAVVGLVDHLSERLFRAEERLARAELERDLALGVARQTNSESAILVRQLNAYCQSLVQSNCALAESNESKAQLRNDLDRLQTALAELAASPLAFPIRSRLMGLAQGIEVDAEPVPDA